MTENGDKAAHNAIPPAFQNLFDACAHVHSELAYLLFATGAYGMNPTRKATVALRQNAVDVARAAKRVQPAADLLIQFCEARLREQGHE